MHHWYSGDDTHRHDDGTQHDRGSEVALGEAHTATDRAHETEWHDAVARDVHLVLMACEVVGQESDGRQLEELRGLETEGTDAHPRARVVDLGADAGGERKHHRPCRENHEWNDQHPPSVVRHLDDDEHRHQAERRPTQLTIEDRVRRHISPDVVGRCRGQHHDQAQHHEEGDDDRDAVEDSGGGTE
jgi:hypothetical protein